MSHWYKKHAFHPFSLSFNAVPPNLSVMALENTSLITAVGKDAISYLQGQLTCCLTSMENTNATLAAHCDPKGKVFSVIRLFHHLDGLAYIQPQSVTDSQLKEIKKYAVFSQVHFEKSEQVLIGIAGNKADSAVQSRFITPGNVRPTQTGTAIKIDNNRWLLAIDASEADTLIAEFGERAVLSDQSLWDLYDIQAGIPRIEESTTKTFIPQTLNLQALNAISFKKGCYTGQETVARAKYRGINKRATYLLQGETQSLPLAGEHFDRSVGENWRTGGTLLSSYRFTEGETLSLVVLPNDLEPESQFRLAETAPLWHKIMLPYDLD